MMMNHIYHVCVCVYRAREFIYINIVYRISSIRMHCDLTYLRSMRTRARVLHHWPRVDHFVVGRLAAAVGRYFYFFLSLPLFLLLRSLFVHDCFVHSAHSVRFGWPRQIANEKSMVCTFSQHE